MTAVPIAACATSTVQSDSISRNQWLWPPRNPHDRDRAHFLNVDVGLHQTANPSWSQSPVADVDRLINQHIRLSGEIRQVLALLGIAGECD